MSSGRPSKMSAAQRRNGRNVLIIAIILVGVTAFSLFHGGEAMELGFEDDKMTITDPEGAPFVVTISYRDIRSVSERSPADALELGACQEGLDTSRCRFGTWSNDAYGDYTLCASPRVSSYIVLETAPGVVVFNYESDDSTHHLYLALVDLLRDHGVEV